MNAWKDEVLYYCRELQEPFTCYDLLRVLPGKRHMTPQQVSSRMMILTRMKYLERASREVVDIGGRKMRVTKYRMRRQ